MRSTLPPAVVRGALHAVGLTTLMLAACGRTVPYDTEVCSCPGNQHCVAGACVCDDGYAPIDPTHCGQVCGFGICESTSQCEAGTCVCNAGFVLNAHGQCIGDCRTVDCPTDQVCTGTPTGTTCGCRSGDTLVNGVCQPIAASLDGLRWELPCLTYEPSAPNIVCFTTPDVTKTATLSGDPGSVYEITLHLRGVVETKTYFGGETDGGVINENGTPIDDDWNIYRLDISQPIDHWFLNNGPTGLYVCRAIDELLTVHAQGNATFTLFASSVDSRLSEIRNIDADGGAIVVPDIPPAPAAFDGQFVQMDVVSVTKL